MGVGRRTHEDVEIKENIFTLVSKLCKDLCSLGELFHTLTDIFNKYHWK